MPFSSPNPLPYPLPLRIRDYYEDFFLPIILKTASLCNISMLPSKDVNSYLLYCLCYKHLFQSNGIYVYGESERGNFSFSGKLVGSRVSLFSVWTSSSQAPQIQQLYLLIQLLIVIVFSDLHFSHYLLSESCINSSSLSRAAELNAIHAFPFITSNVCHLSTKSL